MMNPLGGHSDKALDLAVRHIYICTVIFTGTQIKEIGYAAIR